MNNFTQTINGDVSGTINTTESGAITSVNNINNLSNKEELKKLIKELKQEVKDCEGISNVDKDDLIDDIELLEENVERKETVKKRLEKTINRIKDGLKALPQATGGVLTIISNADKIKDIIQTNF